MKLQWKSYGDTGRTALGDLGRWRIISDGMWWHLTLFVENRLSAEENRGKFVDRERAMEYAQEREDGVTVKALGGVS